MHAMEVAQRIEDDLRQLAAAGKLDHSDLTSVYAVTVGPDGQRHKVTGVSTRNQNGETTVELQVVPEADSTDDAGDESATVDAIE